MKLLKNVLLKMSRGGRTDLILYVDNLPEDYLYEMAYPIMYVGKGRENHKEPDLSKPKTPTLRLGVTDSLTGDKGILIDMDREQGQTIWATIDRYIHQMTPPNQRLQAPVANSVQPSKASAAPLPLDKIPRAVLPVLSPPSGEQGSPVQAAPAVGTVTAAPTLGNDKKAAAQARMAKARAAKVQKHSIK